MEKKNRVCPKCGELFDAPPAISRENGAEICPDCGMLEALSAVPPVPRMPRAAMKATLAWMKEQMYGEPWTEWHTGNEYDRMREAADLLEELLHTGMMKRSCTYGIYKMCSPHGVEDPLLSTGKFTVFGKTTEDLDTAMEAKYTEIEASMGENEYIDDCNSSDDVPAAWDEVRKEWV